MHETINCSTVFKSQNCKPLKLLAECLPVTPIEIREHFPPINTTIIGAIKKQITRQRAHGPCSSETWTFMMRMDQSYRRRVQEVWHHRFQGRRGSRRNRYRMKQDMRACVCARMYTHAHMHTLMHTYTCTRVRTCIHMHTHVHCTCARMCARTHVCTYTRMDTQTHVHYTWAHMHVHARGHMCKRSHMHVHSAHKHRSTHACPHVCTHMHRYTLYSRLPETRIANMYWGLSFCPPVRIFRGRLSLNREHGYKNIKTNCHEKFLIAIYL